MGEILNSIFSSTLNTVGGFFSYIAVAGFRLIIFALVISLIVYLWRLYLHTIQDFYLKSQEWSFVIIRVPKINELSTLAVEQVFSQIHAIQSKPTFAQKYIEGVTSLWFSLEIVSLGGKISFIIRCPKQNKQLIQSAFYAQYPDAEITEIPDYLENINFESVRNNLEMWGAELYLENEYSLPIKTYRDFEHLSAKEKIVDPLRPLFESLASITTTELFAIQILVKPVKDSFWKPKGEKVAQELITGVKQDRIIFNPFSKIWKPFSSVQASPEKERNFSILSDVEKERVNSVLRKVGKSGYKTLVRLLYLAPKDTFDKDKPSLFIGAFGTVSSANTNGFRVNSAATPEINYKLSEALERPYIEHLIERRKRSLFENFRARKFGKITAPYILNLEELATIYHLPLVGELETPSSGLETVSSKKSHPPQNLPIGEYS